jgi:hypothetical protein
MPFIVQRYLMGIRVAVLLEQVQREWHGQTGKHRKVELFRAVSYRPGLRPDASDFH